MKHRQLGKWALCIVLAGAAASAFVACKGTGNFEAKGSAFGANGSLSGSYHDCNGQRCAHLDQIHGNARVDIEFRDGAGNKIPGSGATGAGVGDSVPVPAGATVMTISGPSSAGSCTGCGGGGSGGGGGGGGMAFDPQAQVVAQTRQVAPTSDLFFYVFPLDAAIDVNDPDFGPLSNSYASFDFNVFGPRTASQLWAQVAPIMLSDMGNQPGVQGNVTVNFLTRMIPNANGIGARLFVADKTAGFESFEFTLNGTVLATLTSGSVVYDAPMGWKVIEVPVSGLSFLIDGDSSSNDFRIEADTVEGGVEGYEGAVAYW